MRRFHSPRWLLLALLIALIPASSFAGVFISVGFAPPILPVYVQPVCPGDGLMWTPGYWAYGPDGYYWVPAPGFPLLTSALFGLRPGGAGPAASMSFIPAIGARMLATTEA